jgi:hypothetical protein
MTRILTTSIILGVAALIAVALAPRHTFAAENAASPSYQIAITQSAVTMNPATVGYSFQIANYTPSQAAFSILDVQAHEVASGSLSADTTDQTVMLSPGLYWLTVVNYDAQPFTTGVAIMPNKVVIAIVGRDR